MTNFKTMIKELVSAGESTALIAHKSGCSESYIKQLRQGKRNSPSYGIGSTIVELHKEKCGDAAS